MRGIIAVETPMSLVKIRRRFPRTREIFTIDAESYRRRCSVLRAAKNCDLRGTANASRRNYSREKEREGERDTLVIIFLTNLRSHGAIPSHGKIGIFTRADARRQSVSYHRPLDSLSEKQSFQSNFT